jgi:hypothetical protein
MAEQNAGNVVLWRARVRTKDGREALTEAVPVEGEDTGKPQFSVRTGEADANGEAKDQVDKLPPQMYRFRVRTASGHEAFSKVVVVRPDAPDANLLKNPRWDGKSFAHGSKATLSVEAPKLDDRQVKFIVERRERGSWVRTTEQVAVVAGGKAQATITVEHQGQKNPRMDLLRFRAQLIR